MRREREKLIVEYIPPTAPSIDRAAVIRFMAGLSDIRFAEILADVKQARETAFQNQRRGANGSGAV